MVYAVLIVAYLIGSLSFAVIVSKWYNLDDPRTYGSNNAGATNVMRSGNKKAAVLTLLGDALKGLVVVIIAKIIFHNEGDASTIAGLAGILVVTGHIFPIFFKFKGGKGVATAIGVFLGFSFWLFLLLVLTWLLVYKLSKISSLSAIIATVLSPLYAYFLLGNNAYFGATIIIAFFVLYKHKSNLLRLIKKEEKPINLDGDDESN